MTISVACPSCSSQLSAPDSLAGRKVKCPKCGTSFPVPAPGPADDGGFSRGEENLDRREPEPEFDRREEEDDRPRRRRRQQSSSSFADYLLFRRMIAPTVIQVLFWLMVTASIIMGAIYFVMGILALTTSRDVSVGIVGALVGALTGLFTMIAGPFVARLYAELLIIFFRIYETLLDIKDELGKR